MPSYIVKFETLRGDRYLMWSSVVDAPVTYGVDLERFRVDYREEYGARGMLALDERLDRVRESGTSDAIDRRPVRMWIAGNRAGKNETELTYEQIVEEYCR